MPITRPKLVDLAVAQRLIELVHGTWQTHVVAAMAGLKLADQLGAGPRPVAELAERVAANPDALERLLRACAALGLVHDTGPAGFALTRLGACLRTGQSSLRDLALVAAAPVMLRPYDWLTEAVRTGAPTAVAALGKDVWSYARDHPQEARWFAGAMSGLSALVAAELPDRVDLTGVRHVVDVGGGHGLLLTALLDAAPGAVGTLFDPARRDRHGEPSAGGPHPACRGHSEGVPAGGDLYVPSHILHDWDDEHATQILRACHRAAQPGAGLLVVEQVLLPQPPASACSPPQVDLAMLVALGGRERTRVDYERLLAEAGWRLTDVQRLGSGQSALRAHAVLLGGQQVGRAGRRTAGQAHGDHVPRSS